MAHESASVNGKSNLGTRPRSGPLLSGVARVPGELVKRRELAAGAREVQDRMRKEGPHLRAGEGSSQIESQPHLRAGEGSSHLRQDEGPLVEMKEITFWEDSIDFEISGMVDS